MDQETIRRRNANAIEELHARGALRSGALPPGLRLAMALFPNLRAPYYGDRAAYGVIMGVLFGVPLGIFFCVMLALDETYSIWWGIILSAGAGLGMGFIYSGYMESVHRRMQLTPWDQLDSPPGAETPEEAESHKEIQDEYVERYLRPR